MTNRMVQWPKNSYLVIEPHKLLFCPIGKNACTSIKTLALLLSDLEGKEEIAKKNIIHAFLIENTTGLMLQDHDVSDAMRILSNDEYFKIALLRNPYDRTVSGYIQKFVTNRADKGGLSMTKSVIDWVYKQREEEPDYNRSITFREFIRYLISHSDNDLDVHWKPQRMYLSDVRFDYMGRVEDPDGLKAILAKERGVRIELPRLNVTPRVEAQFDDASSLEHMLPDELLELPTLPKARDFVSATSKILIRERYKVDFDLYEAHFGKID